MRKIGLMGGTFDPIHIGHLLLAETVRDTFDLDEIWFIPTGCSYMKAGQLEQGAHKPAPVQRYEMTCMAVANHEGFRCVDIEVCREGYTYTYETLVCLKEQFPEEEFYFIFGADCLFDIEKWKEPQRIFDSCSVIAAVRGAVSIEEMQAAAEHLREKYHARVLLMPFYNLEISSTQIRERVAAGKSIRYMVPDEVLSYIRDKGFYRAEP